MTYEAAFNTETEIVLGSTLSSVNLFTLAGAPSQVVEITFILDSSNSQGEVAIRAGSFAAGSKIILIMVGGFDGQARGGFGGFGQEIEWDSETNTLITLPPGNGENGGVVYDAQGINSDIYFSGATPSTSYPVADGYMRAPSGGAGGFDYTGSFPSFVSGDGGDAGDGRLPGTGGNAGLFSGSNTSGGNAGTNGEVNGTGSGWGNAGANNGATGGAAGSGILDSGATTVNLFADGDLATRYINGNGDH
jgi:hypothetical protein